MKKQHERTPEEIAKDLESIDFAEISEEEIKAVFGGEVASTNCNCGPW